MFTLSLRDVEELLAQRGIEVSYETIAVIDRAYLRWYVTQGAKPPETSSSMAG